MSEKNPSPGKIRLRQKMILVLSGLGLFFVLLEAGLRAGGAGLSLVQEYRNTIALRQKGSCRIMCIGESTTQNQYPALLEKALERKNTGIKFSVIDKGRTGTISSVILSRIESYLNECRPDIVVAMMGVNDYGVHLPHDNAASSKSVAFLRSLRIYKLIRFLGLHVDAKFQWHLLRFFRLRLDQVYASPQDDIENEDAFEECIKSKHKNDHCWVKIGRLNYGRGRLKEAELFFQKALEADPGNDKAYSGLGWVYYSLNDMPKAVAFFNKALKLNSNDDSAYLERARIYDALGRFKQAEEYFIKAIEQNPGQLIVYYWLGRLYHDLGQFPQADACFRKIIELNPLDEMVYFEVGRLSREHGQFPQAEACFNKIIELNPLNEKVYIEAGRLYLEQDKFQEAVKSFEKAAELNPGDAVPYVELSRAYFDRGQFSDEEMCLKRAIQLDPRSDRAYFELGRLCYERQQFVQAEEYFKYALKGKHGDKARVYGALGTIYLQMGRLQAAQECLENASRVRSEFYLPVTAYNFRKLKDILDKRNIKLVCVQYPMRNLEPLKRIFQDNDAGVVFVDNEKTFKNEVKAGSYKEYFTDMFGGDFGHCTNKGNQLLAENIANGILKSLFHE